MMLMLIEMKKLLFLLTLAILFSCEKITITPDCVECKKCITHIYYSDGEVQTDITYSCDLVAIMKREQLNCVRTECGKQVVYATICFTTEPK